MPIPCDFSIIVTARNEGPAIVTALNHMLGLAQCFNGEVLIVDDASEIPVSDWVYLRGLRHVRLSQRHGVARAANIGAGHAVGRMLIFADAHVCFDMDLIVQLRKAFEGEPDAIVGCSTTMLNNYETFSQLALGRRSTKMELGIDDVRYGWMFNPKAPPTTMPIRTWQVGVSKEVPYVSSCMMAMSRSLFNYLGGFDTGLIGFGSAQDAEICCHAWTTGHRVLSLGGVTCWHYSSGNREPDRIPGIPLALLDWPQYPGSMMNELRIAYTYFPDYFFAAAVENTNARCREMQIPEIDPAILTADWALRREAIRAQSHVKPQWLMERMTQE